jgi:hypothetical protein
LSNFKHTQPSTGRTSAQSPRRAIARELDAHEDAVTQAEVRRLARALAPYGILGREALERAARANHWRQGAFESALASALRSGTLEQLPYGFYRLRDSDASGTQQG